MAKRTSKTKTTHIIQKKFGESEWKDWYEWVPKTGNLPQVKTRVVSPQVKTRVVSLQGERRDWKIRLIRRRVTETVIVDHKEHAKR